MKCRASCASSMANEVRIVAIATAVATRIRRENTLTPDERSSREHTLLLEHHIDEIASWILIALSACRKHVARLRVTGGGGG
jgi:hypothetical protein